MESTPLLYNPLDLGFLADPYPTYADLRANDPVHLSPFGFWVVSRHQDCLNMIRDPRCSVDYRQDRGALAHTAPNARHRSLKDLDTFLFLDDPEHSRLRSQVSGAFSVPAIESLEPFIRAEVDRALEPLREGEATELIEALAYPLPIDVICRILGLGASDWREVRAWSAALGRGLDPEFTQTAESLDEGERALRELLDFFGAEIARRRSSPEDGLLWKLARSDAITPEEAAATCILLLIAGHETTANLIGNGVVALLTSGAESAVHRLADDADTTLFGRAVEELLRFDAPIQLTKRIPLQSVTVAGRVIEAGDMVVLLLGSANRDHDVFAEPDVLDFDRDSNPHLAFGGGAHYCVGARLARAEGRIVLEALASLLPSVELVERHPPVKEGVVVRGRSRVDVRRL